MTYQQSIEAHGHLPQLELLSMAAQVLNNKIFVAVCFNVRYVCQLVHICQRSLRHEYFFTLQNKQVAGEKDRDLSSCCSLVFSYICL